MALGHAIQVEASWVFPFVPMEVYMSWEHVPSPHDFCFECKYNSRHNDDVITIAIPSSWGQRCRGRTYRNVVLLGPEATEPPCPFQQLYTQIPLFLKEKAALLRLNNFELTFLITHGFFIGAGLSGKEHGVCRCVMGLDVDVKVSFLLVQSVLVHNSDPVLCLSPTLLI